eukprot:44664_1
MLPSMTDEVIADKVDTEQVDSMHWIIMLAAYKSIRKNYLFQNKNCFTRLFGGIISLAIVLERTKQSGDPPYTQRGIRSIALSLHGKQIRWIISNKLLLNVLMEFGRSPSFDWLYLLFMRKILCYVPEDVDDNSLLEWNKVIRQNEKHINQKAMYEQRICDAKKIKCGNQKCHRDYITDKYGAVMEDVYFNKNKKWNNNNAKSKWYLCNGCKTTYYCSRRCQKYGWSRYGHKRQCIKLQKLMIAFINK